RTGADHRYSLAGAHAGWLGRDPALLPALVDDGVLQALDRHRRGVDPEHAGALARRRAHFAREIREVVGLVQALERLPPEAAVDEVVPLRDQVVDRTARGHARDELARVAERHAAVHAARGLIAQALLVHVMVKLLPVTHPLHGRAVHGELAQILDETSRLAHPMLDL